MTPLVIRDDPTSNVAVVVDLRCPKCTNLHTVKVVQGFIGSNVRRGLTIADWDIVRKYAETCFKEEHRCTVETSN